MGTKRKIGKRSDQLPGRRPLRCDAAFAVDGVVGENAASQTVFFEFYHQMYEEVFRRDRRKLREDRRKLTALKTVGQRADPIVKSVLFGTLAPEIAAKQLEHLIPDKEVRMKLFERWQKASQASPESVAKAKADGRRAERESAELRRVNEAQRTIHSALKLLNDEIEHGNPHAVRGLAEVAASVGVLFEIHTRRDSASFRELARTALMWPVMATDDPDWMLECVARLKELEFAEAENPFRVRFRAARGKDENYPARRWAKAAVRCIEESKFNVAMLGHLCDKLGGVSELTRHSLDKGWGICPAPEWLLKGRLLPPFSKAGLRDWKPVVREMIREQLPDFHKYPEWSNQTRGVTARGRKGRGEVQNCILDDICSALGRIAPQV